MEKQRFTILSIEDNQPDFVLLKKALDAIPDLSLDIINVTNGQQALDFIYKKGEYESAPTPDIIILDINLPAISGQEILKVLKTDEQYKLIPVIIFSTSNAEKDIKESYELYANSYITKTFDVKHLFRKIASLGEYWLKTSEIPDISNFCFVKKRGKKKNEDSSNRRQ